ncbi:MAG: hypothetical protein AB7N76_19960 [Planctomycetota bacterium]
MSALAPLPEASYREGPYAALAAAARAALQGNVVESSGARGLAAGANQFRSLWTRDFAHAAEGLRLAGLSGVLREHLDLLLDRLHPENGLLPRTLDSMDAKLRVAWASAARLLPGASPALAMGPELRPEYRDQHGQFAIDGNALVVLAALRYAETEGEDEWLAARRETLERALAAYRRWLRDGLVRQPPFSDWQDSVRRAGQAFYTNLLVHLAARALAARGGAVPTAFLAPLRALLHERFLGPEGLYRSLVGRPHVSLDGNLLALDHGLVGGEAAGRLYAALRASPFWRGEAPGWNTYPDWPRSWRNPGVLLAGLGHYHDRIPWSWLTALAAKVALGQGDREGAARCLDALARRVARDGAVVEIYDAEPPHRPFRSLLYRSEAPFSWGAGRTLEAVAAWRAAGPE